MAIFELKHGELNVSLQICNESFQDAIPKFEAETEVTVQELFNGGGSGWSYLLMIYAYFSYKLHCKQNNAMRHHTYDAFRALISKDGVPVEHSNLAQCFEAMQESIIATVKKKVEEMELNELKSKKETVSNTSPEPASTNITSEE